MSINWNEPIELEDGSPATFFNFIGNGRHIYNDIPNVRNKIMPALDSTKLLQVNGKEAKIIHTFNNGNLAVVADGSEVVYTFRPDGTPLLEGGYRLLNRIEETFRFVIVCPEAYGSACRYIHKTIEASDTTWKIGNKYDNGAFRVKQTLHDGVVVKTELI